MAQSFHRSFAPGGNSIRIREDTNAAPTAPGFQLRWKRLRRPSGPDQYVARISLHGLPVFLTIFPNMDRKTVTPGLSPCYPNAPRVTSTLCCKKYNPARPWAGKYNSQFNSNKFKKCWIWVKNDSCITYHNWYIYEMKYEVKLMEPAVEFILSQNDKMQAKIVRIFFIVNTFIGSCDVVYQHIS